MMLVRLLQLQLVLLVIQLVLLVMQLFFLANIVTDFAGIVTDAAGIDSAHVVATIDLMSIFMKSKFNFSKPHW